MNHIKRTYALVASLLLIGSITTAILVDTGCSTSEVTTAYKTESAIDASVVAAWKGWQTYLSLNPGTSTNTIHQVSAAFNKVKAVELVAIDSTTLAAGTTNGITLSNAVNSVQAISPALTDLGNLLATFNIKL